MKTNNLDQLRSEKAEAERKRDQAERQANRYTNQIEYVQKRSRSERTHHLCIIGGTVESVAPIFKDLTETEIIVLMGQIFELPQVQAMLRKREVKPDGPVPL
jgi:hypothetical protein